MRHNQIIKGIYYKPQWILLLPLKNQHPRVLHPLPTYRALSLTWTCFLRFHGYSGSGWMGIFHIAIYTQRSWGWSLIHKAWSRLLNYPANWTRLRSIIEQAGLTHSLAPILYLSFLNTFLPSLPEGRNPLFRGFMRTTPWKIVWPLS